MNYQVSMYLLLFENISNLGQLNHDKLFNSILFQTFNLVGLGSNYDLAQVLSHFFESETFLLELKDSFLECDIHDSEFLKTGRNKFSRLKRIEFQTGFLSLCFIDADVSRPFFDWLV